MTTASDVSSWDFSQALRLNSTLSFHRDRTAVKGELASEAVHVVDDGADLENGVSLSLGNFNKIWDFLGAPHNAPSPLPPSEAPPSDSTSAEAPPDKDTYASDGAAYRPSSTKGVRWRDDYEGSGLEDTAGDTAEDAADDEEQDDTQGPSTPKPLTKTQRKKARRRERKAKEREEIGQSSRAVSEAESESEGQFATNTPARKASVHTLQAAPELRTEIPRYNLRSHNAPKTPQVKTPEPVKNKTAEPPPTAPRPVPVRQISAIPHTPKTPSKAPIHITPQSVPNFKSTFAQLQPSTVKPLQPATQPLRPAVQHSSSYNHLPQQASPPKHSGAGPATVNPSFYLKPENAANDQATAAVALSVLKQSKALTIRTGKDRHYHFLLKLIHDFGADMDWLVAPAQRANHNSHPDGIHVFIDYSNIFIGFHDVLKRLLNYPPRARLPNIDLSFDALVLLLERRRPVSKRVLAGSSPLLPAFDVAKAIGYETNILDKVYKAKELTERQKYFQQNPYGPPRRHRGNSHSNAEDTAGSGGSGSEMGPSTSAGPVFAPEKWVEQGVDEILHLKILESIVDCDVPTTIVLATGDAAEAEYSQGFMKMVERALVKGWKVELMSWRKNVSMAYRRGGFTRKWKDAFRIIELDEYVEDLIDI